MYLGYPKYSILQIITMEKPLNNTTNATLPEFYTQPKIIPSTPELLPYSSDEEDFASYPTQPNELTQQNDASSIPDLFEHSDDGSDSDASSQGIPCWQPCQAAALGLTHFSAE